MKSFRIAGLEVTVHGRSEAPDYYDGNWAYGQVSCEAPGARVTVEGTFLHLPELAGWLAALRQMDQTLAGSADLKPMDPNLSIQMAINPLGQIRLSVRLTPEPSTQEHRFDFTIDQSHLQPLIEQLESVLQEFPVRGGPDE